MQCRARSLLGVAHTREVVFMQVGMARQTLTHSDTHIHTHTHTVSDCEKSAGNQLCKVEDCPRHVFSPNP
jgi:hypothetical protein